MQQTENHYQHDIVRNMNFDEYVTWRCNEYPTSQLPYMLDKTGMNCVTDLARFETLSDDFNAFMSSVGVKTTLPHRNKSDHKPYRDYYNDRTLAMIEELSRDDIGAFGYEF